MAEMSPLARLLLKILRSGALAAGLLLLCFAALLVWQRSHPENGISLSRQDWGFLAVLFVLVLLAAYLVRAIGKEINRDGG
ncbi:MAG: hypothetical protein LCH46_04365 [Proteobacteria bacterium]|nr:hypothetical protein [Pseudomonadota bacterium]